MSAGVNLYTERIYVAQSKFQTGLVAQPPITADTVGALEQFQPMFPLQPCIAGKL